MRRRIVKFREWSEENLRRLCGRITPEKRLAVILAMFILFAVTSLYVLASAIYEIGKNEGRRIEIEHIEGLQLQKRDTINNLNFYDNGTDE